MDKKQIIMGLLLLLALTLIVGCDLELAHVEGESHDHDGDGVEDHSADEHEDEINHHDDEGHK